MGFRNHLNTKVHAWSMYDWANSAFATSAAVAIVPVYFVSLFKASFGDSVDVLGFNFTGSSLWAFAGAISALTLVIVGPILGEIADREGKTQKYLFIFTVIGSLAIFLCIFTSFWGPGWLWLLFCFAIASFGFLGSCMFINSLMTSVADKSEYDRVSSMGYAYGYLGGGLLLIFHFIVIFMYQDTSNEDLVVRFSIASVGIWWFLWSLWTFWKIPETKPKKTKQEKFNFVSSFKRISVIPMLLPFFIAFFLFNEGIQTVLSVSGAYGADVLGIDLIVNMALIVIVQLVAAPGAIFFGWLADKWGTKNSLLTTLVGWIIVVFLALSFAPFEPDSEEEFDVILRSEGSGAYMVEMPKGEVREIDYKISSTPLILRNGNKIIEGDVTYLLNEIDDINGINFSIFIIGGKLDNLSAIGGDHPSNLQGDFLEKWSLIVRNILWKPLNLDVTYQWIFLGILVGSFMGGSQALSRSYFASLIPVDRSGELFGYFAAVGRISTVMGPLLYFASVGLFSQRMGVFVIAILIVIGTILFKWPSLIYKENEE